MQNDESSSWRKNLKKSFIIKCSFVSSKYLDVLILQGSSSCNLASPPSNLIHIYTDAFCSLNFIDILKGWSESFGSNIETAQQSRLTPSCHTLQSAICCASAKLTLFKHRRSFVFANHQLCFRLAIWGWAKRNEWSMWNLWDLRVKHKYLKGTSLYHK